METPKQTREPTDAEIRAIHDKWRKVRVGDVVPVLQVMCRVTNVNGGKRRLTLSPTAGVPMPGGETDPVVGVTDPPKKPKPKAPAKEPGPS